MSDPTPFRQRPNVFHVTFAVLAGVLLLTFALPLIAFLPDVDGGELARQVGEGGLGRAIAVSAASATLATLLAALGGVPLGYLLARDRLPVPWLIRTTVLVPLVLPPVAAGVLLLNVYGPGGLIGAFLERAGWTLANALGGIIVAQVFITAPFVILTAEAAFRAVDDRLEAVAATLGRRPGEVFRRVSLPLARYGLAAGLALAWMRAAGEFGATVVLAYHPRSLPVQLWVELTGRGLRAALPVALVALALAATALWLAERFAARTRSDRGAAGLRGPARQRRSARSLAEVTAPSIVPRGDRSREENGIFVIEADFSLRLGDFRLRARLQAGEEILSLFGPSGAGKSTLLRVLSGLAHPDSGHVKIDGLTVSGEGGSVPPEERPIGLVLQEPSLFPHLDVRANVLFATPGRRDEARLPSLLQLTRLEGLESRYPTELSGGQQQRVALARALMRQPRVLLLDEPFSSLDMNMRERLQRDVREIQAAFGLCVIYVTHELRDACAMGDRMAVIGEGRIEQTGPPLEVIRRPATYDVARFVGMRNLFEGEVLDVDGDLVAVRVGRVTLRAAGAGPLPAGTHVHVCVRPEDFRIMQLHGAEPGSAINELSVRIWNRVLRGPTFTLTGEASGAEDGMRIEIELDVRSYEAMQLIERSDVTVVVPASAVHLIPRTPTTPALEPAAPVTTVPPGSS